MAIDSGSRLFAPCAAAGEASPTVGDAKQGVKLAPTRQEGCQRFTRIILHLYTDAVHRPAFSSQTRLPTNNPCLARLAAFESCTLELAGDNDFTRSAKPKMTTASCLTDTCHWRICLSASGVRFERNFDQSHCLIHEVRAPRERWNAAGPTRVAPHAGEAPNNSDVFLPGEKFAAKSPSFPTTFYFENERTSVCCYLSNCHTAQISSVARMHLPTSHDVVGRTFTRNSFSETLLHTLRSCDMMCSFEILAFHAAIRLYGTFFQPKIWSICATLREGQKNCSPCCFRKRREN